MQIPAAVLKLFRTRPGRVCSANNLQAIARLLQKKALKATKKNRRKIFTLRRPKRQTFSNLKVKTQNAA
jgi:hypothetical protein